MKPVHEPWSKSRVANYSKKTPVFVNKVLFEHDPTQSFTYCLWLLLNFNGSTEQ